MFPDFKEIAKQAQQFMVAVNAQAAEVRAMRNDINRLVEENRLLRQQLQRIEQWMTMQQKAA